MESKLYTLTIWGSFIVGAIYSWSGNYAASASSFSFGVFVKVVLVPEYEKRVDV